MNKQYNQNYGSAQDIDQVGKEMISIIPLGGTGVGKSLLANYILDGYNSKKFKSSNTVEGGETQEITSQAGYLLGDKKMKQKIQMYDVPGLADPEMKMSTWLKQWIEKLTGQEVDIIVIVLKYTDMRITLAQMISFAIIKSFFAQFPRENVYVCFTHCDISKPNKNYIQDKIDSFYKYCKYQINQNNIILFKGDQQNQEDLQNKAKNFKKSNFRMIPDMKQIENFQKQLDEILANIAAQDPSQAKNLKGELNYMRQEDLGIKVEIQPKKQQRRQEKIQSKDLEKQEHLINVQTKQKNQKNNDDKESKNCPPCSIL